MKIQNDQIEIQASDIAELSPQLQADVIFRAGPNTTPHEYLSARFNAVLEEAANIHTKELLKTEETVSLAFVHADATKQEAVKTILGVQFLPETLLTKKAA